MIDKVVKLEVVPREREEAPKPNEGVVALLREALHRACTGEIQAVFVAAALDDADTMQGFHCGDGTYTHILTAAVTYGAAKYTRMALEATDKDEDPATV